jgi:hypothetical protein
MTGQIGKSAIGGLTRFDLSALAYAGSLYSPVPLLGIDR